MEKPIPIETYKCPKCNVRIEGSYEKAQKHVDMPISNTLLPIGLVLGDNMGAWLSITRDEPQVSTEDHSLMQKYRFYSTSIGLWSCTSRYMDSREVIEWLQKGHYCLLTPKTFERFMAFKGSKIPNEKFIRTTSELEKLAQTNSIKSRKEVLKNDTLMRK